MGWAGGMASGPAHLLGGAVSRVVCSALLLPPEHQKRPLFVAYLYPVAHNRPHSPMHAVILVTYSCSPSLFGTRDQFHRRQFFHDWDRVMVSG